MRRHRWTPSEGTGGIIRYYCANGCGWKRERAVRPFGVRFGSVLVYSREGERGHDGSGASERAPECAPIYGPQLPPFAPRPCPCGHLIDGNDLDGDPCPECRLGGGSCHACRGTGIRGLRDGDAWVED